MATLNGVRIHLSGALPKNFDRPNMADILTFVRKFATSVLQQGGTIVHGSHPHFIEPLRVAAMPFIVEGGSRDKVTLVRAGKHSLSEEQKQRIAEQRKWATVEVIPSDLVSPDRNLMPMRDWMADRCDVVVALGGKWRSATPLQSGVVQELEAMLSIGKPGFVLGGFGGAAAGYLNTNASLFSRLQNGLTVDQNRVLAEQTDIDRLVENIVEKIKLLPLRRGAETSNRHFRILALDGGGIRGVFTAAVLSRWAKMLGESGPTGLVKHFDLVAGTSTGAILAIGLGMGLAPDKILQFYRSEGPKIFPKDRSFRHWLKSKHDSETLEATLRKVFLDRKLADSVCRLVIPTVRAQRGHADVIVTAHKPNRVAYRDFSAVQAALASAAAPTYFDEAIIEDEIASRTYLDGGVWANNPVLPAIAEALRYLGVSLDRIDVLSVGTLGNEKDFTKTLGGGKAAWATSSVDLFFAAQESAAMSIADSLLGRARHLRVNQQTPVEIALDDIEAIESMALRGSEAGQDSFDEVQSRFLDGIYVPDWHPSY